MQTLVQHQQQRFFLALSEQPYAKTGVAGLIGAPPLVMQHQIATEKIFGSRSSLFDDNFESLVTTVPTNNWYWVVAASALHVTAGAISIFMEIQCDTEFYGRTFLQN